jgi:hypothetical protein
VVILLLLHRLVDEFLEVGPEDVVFGFLEVMEIVLLDGVDKEARPAEPHEDAGDESYPGKFHAHSGALIANVGPMGNRVCFVRVGMGCGSGFA